MSELRVVTEWAIAASAGRLYHLIADFDRHDRGFSLAFSELRVEEGGLGPALCTASG